MATTPSPSMSTPDAGERHPSATAAPPPPQTAAVQTPVPITEELDDISSQGLVEASLEGGEPNHVSPSMHWQYIAIVATVLSVSSYLPFMYNVYSKGRADQISFLYLIFALTASSLWLAYSARNAIWPVLANSVIWIAMYLTMMAMKTYFDRQQQQSGEGVLKRAPATADVAPPIPPSLAPRAMAALGLSAWHDPR